jgi:putative endonuclease
LWRLFLLWENEFLPFIVYVIQSQEGYQYTGMTSDLTKRLEEHNSKSLSFWTKRGTEWKIIESEEFGSNADALKRERWLKSGIGREYLLTKHPK